MSTVIYCVLEVHSTNDYNGQGLHFLREKHDLPEQNMFRVLSNDCDAVIMRNIRFFLFTRKRLSPYYYKLIYYSLPIWTQINFLYSLGVRYLCHIPSSLWFSAFLRFLSFFVTSLLVTFSEYLFIHLSVISIVSICSCLPASTGKKAVRKRKYNCRESKV